MFRTRLGRMLYGLLAGLLLCSGLVVSNASPAAAATNAVGTVRCKVGGNVTFSPPITNTPKAGVKWSFAGNVVCKVATTGTDKVLAKTGLLQATSAAGTFSCTTLAYPSVTARILWTTNTGAAISPTYINWTSPGSAFRARDGLKFATGAGQVVGSYGGSNNWLKFVGRKVPIGNCATAGGLAGYKVTPGDNPDGLYIGTCSNGQAPPARYDHVVVFQFQNRRWDQVGGPGFTDPAMPYLHSLAASCNYFKDYTEVDKLQGSMVQNIGQMTGAKQPNAAVNCYPSATCFSTANNIFRQLRVAGRTAVNYVEGVSEGCQPAVGIFQNDPVLKAWPHWVPYLYFKGADDPSYCNVHVRPYSEFNVNALPAFSFITPTECNIGHFPLVPTCANANVDNWARANIGRVINSVGYRTGHVAVFVWYDEDYPVANMQITPTANEGVNNTRGITYASTLQTWQSMLGLPCLAYACYAPNERVPANI